MDKLLALGFRASIDKRDEKLGYRLREAQIMKVPVQIIIGDKEIENNSINVRRYGQREQNPFNLDEYINILNEEIKNKS